MTIPSPRYAGPLLMLLALVLRIAAIEAHPISRSLFADMDNYRGIADAILRGEWVPDISCQRSGSRWSSQR